MSRHRIDFTISLLLDGQFFVLLYRILCVVCIQVIRFIVVFITFLNSPCHDYAVYIFCEYLIRFDFQIVHVFLNVIITIKTLITMLTKPLG